MHRPKPSEHCGAKTMTALPLMGAGLFASGSVSAIGRPLFGRHVIAPRAMRSNTARRTPRPVPFWVPSSGKARGRVAGGYFGGWSPAGFSTGQREAHTASPSSSSAATSVATGKSHNSQRL